MKAATYARVARDDGRDHGPIEAQRRRMLAWLSAHDELEVVAAYNDRGSGTTPTWPAGGDRGRPVRALRSAARRPRRSAGPIGPQPLERVLDQLDVGRGHAAFRDRAQG